MSGIYLNQGKTEEALNLFQESLELKERIGNVQGKAATLSWMGGIAYENGDIQTALAYWKESLEILERIGSPEAEMVKGLMAEVMGNRLNQDFQD